MVKRGMNTTLIIIGLLGFIASSFFLMNNDLAGGFLLSLFFMILFLEAFIVRMQLNHHKRQHSTRRAKRYYTPLSSGFMLTSMIGILMSLVVLVPFSLSWGITFTAVFGIMFFASILSMSNGPVPDSELESVHLKELAVHDKYKKNQRLD